MKYIAYGFLMLWSVVRGWAFFPRACVQAIKGGGLLRWLRLTFTGLRYQRREALPLLDKDMPGDKIHFLNTGNSDAILLESNGRFALIDAAEDSEYPAGQRSLAYPGWEDYVVDYVKRTAGDAQGKARLDFILGTHAHSDHIGGFDTLLLDPDIEVGRAYLKPYDDSIMRPYEQCYWDNDIVHAQMTAALKVRNVPLIEDIPGETFMLGNFKITLYNRGKRSSGDENDNSIGVLVERGGQRAFLTGDINNISGVEHELAREIGQVELLKAGHHGHNGSSTLAIAASMQPETVIFASRGKASFWVLCRFILAGGTRQLLSTGRFGGIAAVFGENKNKFEYYAIDEFATPLEAKGV